jgi:hypothetical protein
MAQIIMSKKVGTELGPGYGTIIPTAKNTDVNSLSLLLRLPEDSATGVVNSLVALVSSTVLE